MLPAVGIVAEETREISFDDVVRPGGYCMLLATGCGNRVNTAPELAGATSYTLTVKGTATSAAGTALEHSVNVTLQVLQ